MLADAGAKPEHRDEVTLVDHRPRGRDEDRGGGAVRVVERCPTTSCSRSPRSMPREQVAEILRGERRRPRRTGGTSPAAPGNARSYRFDVLCDYGAFRDLQRHRPLTIEWQRLTTEHGYETPAQIDEAGLRSDWERVMQASAETERALLDAGFARAGAVRGVDGLPHPVRDADDRARGDAPHGAALAAGRPPRVPAGRAGDAPPDRRRAPGDRRDVQLRRATTRSTSSAWRPSAARKRSARPCAKEPARRDRAGLGRRDRPRDSRPRSLRRREATSDARPARGRLASSTWGRSRSSSSPRASRSSSATARSTSTTRSRGTCRDFRLGRPRHDPSPASTTPAG